MAVPLGYPLASTSNRGGTCAYARRSRLGVLTLQLMRCRS
jgi:hypothetical protein